MHSRIVLLCVALTAGVALAGCGGEGTEDVGGGGGTVVAAFYPLAYAAQEVAPPGVDVVDLTRAGEEPHDLELTPKDVARLDAARLVVYAGAGFQPAVEDAVEGRGGPSLDVLGSVTLLGHGDDVDPHVWLDPRRYAAVAREIASALGDPARANPFVARLRRLDTELARGLRRCEHRELVTSHAAFGYLADRYGLEQLGLVGLAPETEPGPREVARLADTVRETGATTVFTEPLVSPALAEAIAHASGTRTAELDPLESLTPSREASRADYFSVMRTNLSALREALGCT